MHPFAAFVRVALATMRGHWLFAALLVFLLFFNDYGVPHACGLMVYATDVLGWAQQSSAPGQVVRVSIPALLVTALLLAGSLIQSRRFRVDEDQGSSTGGRIGLGVRLFGFLIFAVGWILPTGTLVIRLDAVDALADAYCTYSGDLCWSIVTATVAGVAATLIGLVGASSRRTFGLVVGWTTLFGALPGAVVGEAMVAAYNHASLSAIYDHWPIVTLSYTARFAWIGAIAALITVRHVDQAVLESARIDGAREPTVFWHMVFARYWPTALAAAAVIAALSLADVATSSLVRIPAYNPIAHVLMEKFHRFEYGMLMALSLWLVAATVPAVGLTLYAIRRRAI
jgi:ABC-type Fe3+ transport system permease subunit